MKVVVLCAILALGATTNIFDEYLTDICTFEGVYYMGSCYRFVNGSMTFYQALAVCIASGGHLLQIDSDMEQTWVAKQLQILEIDTVWLGGTDQCREGSWRWLSNGDSFVHYSAWTSNEPNNSGDGENCLAMERKLQYKWNDKPCAHPTTDTVCETKILFVPSVISGIGFSFPIPLTGERTAHACRDCNGLTV